MTDDLPLDDVDVVASSAPDGRVAGVVLAAGTSSRFGAANKLLATVDDEPVVRRAVRPYVEAGLDPVVVVVGYEHEQVREALAGLSVEFVVNDAYETGQASSVRAGVRALRDDVDAVVVGLGDMPFVSTETVRLLRRAVESSDGVVLAAAYRGERGNPVAFDASGFDAVCQVEGDAGARALVLERGRLVETGDPGVRRDVDEPADLSG